MRARTVMGLALAAIVLTAVLAAAAATRRAATRPPARRRPPRASSSDVLRIGTVNYIDSLNPFNYIEAQSTNAMIMIYPQLVQYGPGMKFEGDWADSWKTSADGKDWTFQLKPDTKWSDGEPLTAADAAWTINTTVKYADGPTAVAAAALAHVKSADAPDATTLVIHYESPVGNVLAQLEHVLHPAASTSGQPKVGTRRQGSEDVPPGAATSRSSAAAPTRSRSTRRRGRRRSSPIPTSTGPPSHASGVALTYYTNSDAVIADLERRPTSTGPTRCRSRRSTRSRRATTSSSTTIPGAETTNITWNSNPAKPKNRELLSPAVKKALSMCVDRDQIIDVVFAGYATKVESLVGHISGALENPNLGPLAVRLCSGEHGARTSSATSGARTASASCPRRPARTRSPRTRCSTRSSRRPRPTSTSTARSTIVKDGFAKLGVKVTQKVGGDTTATYALETGDCNGPESKQYTGFDIAMWDWVGYIDPDFMLSVVTKAQWCSWSDTGANNPAYDKLYDQQGMTVDPAKRAGDRLRDAEDHLRQLLLHAARRTSSRSTPTRRLDGLRPAS